VKRSACAGRYAYTHIHKPYTPPPCPTICPTCAPLQPLSLFQKFRIFLNAAKHHIIANRATLQKKEAFDPLKNGWLIHPVRFRRDSDGIQKGYVRYVLICSDMF